MISPKLFVKYMRHVRVSRKLHGSMKVGSIDGHAHSEGPAGVGWGGGDGGRTQCGLSHTDYARVTRLFTTSAPSILGRKQVLSPNF